MAAVAETRDLVVLHYDADFELVAEITGGYSRLNGICQHCGPSPAVGGTSVLRGGRDYGMLGSCWRSRWPIRKRHLCARSATCAGCRLGALSTRNHRTAPPVTSRLGEPPRG